MDVLIKIFSLIFAISVLSAQEEPLFISLGSNCTPAYVLREIGLRKASYPFDWILSIDGKKLIEILEDNFLHFLDLEYLIPHPVSEILIHKYYHLEFTHEKKAGGLPYFDDNLEQFLGVYQRRIERFRSLNTYPGKVYFVRVPFHLSTHPNYPFHDENNLEISEEYSFRLYEALKMLFPNLDLDLIIFNKSKDEREERRTLSDHIHYYLLNSTPYEVIFKELAHLHLPSE